MSMKTRSRSGRSTRARRRGRASVTELTHLQAPFESTCNIVISQLPVPRGDKTYTSYDPWLVLV